MGIKHCAELQAWEIGIVKRLVAERARHLDAPFAEDYDDLLQECLLQWVSVRQRWSVEAVADRKRLLTNVVRNRLNDLARQATAGKRFGGQVCLSLDAPLGDGEDADTLGETLTAEDCDLPALGERFESVEWRLDLVRALAELSPWQQRICELIAQGDLSMHEIAERLGIPRSTVYYHLQVIREQLAVFGLADYLR
jgi:RNA polymerase sigma factor (sigma-70 family)